MREIWKRIDHYGYYRCTLLTIVVDDKNVVKYFTKWSPSYLAKLGTQHRHWGGSCGQKIQDARLSKEATKLNKRITLGFAFG